MEREKSSSYDTLMKSIFQSSAKIMQKAVVGFDRAKEAEKDLKREQKRAEKAKRESAQNAQSLREAREQVEKLKEELTEQKKKAEETEQQLRLDLSATNAKAEAEYDRAMLEVTENYRAQMPTVQDTIWGAAWQRCLTKLGVYPSSSYWTDMELPSKVAAA